MSGILQMLGSSRQSCAWSATDKSSSLTLSANFLTVTRNSGVSSFQAVRATISRATGKFYFEAGGPNAASSDLYTGLTDSTLVLSPAGDTPSIRVSNAGVQQKNGSPQPGKAIGNWALGASSVQIAVDLGAATWWAKTVADSLWNNTIGDDPATGTGGISFPTFTGALFPYCMLFQNPDDCTANFGGSTFSGTIPAGFQAWG